ncbi:hypothetical protein CPT_Maja_103 [Burkholderia phage Maja]|uniref:Uncharacterized protein n=1 Tax=Burkholderia phage Maja TaxID=2767571 RepID=A0A7S6R7B0_9CAUD|nr:hypothetical protein CPT_Maja_103 [Burkholderia phage Maja]
MALILVKGFDGKDSKGDRIIVARNQCDLMGDRSYGVWALRENYRQGKMVKSWRYITHEQTVEQAIEKFNKINKA